MKQAPSEGLKRPYLQLQRLPLMKMSICSSPSKNSLWRSEPEWSHLLAILTALLDFKVLPDFSHGFVFLPDLRFNMSTLKLSVSCLFGVGSWYRNILEAMWGNFLKRWWYSKGLSCKDICICQNVSNGVLKIDAFTLHKFYIKRNCKQILNSSYW